MGRLLNAYNALRGRNMEVLTAPIHNDVEERKGLVLGFGELGYEGTWHHPENFSQYGKYYQKDGVVCSGINVLADMSVGVGFYLDCEDEAAKKIIEDWCRTVGLDQMLHHIVRTQLVYGFCPVERWVVRGPPVGKFRLKVLPPESVKVRVNLQGKLLGYRQELLGQPVSFRPRDLIWFVYNKMGTSPYGTSKVAPILDLLKAKAQTNKDIPKIIHRYSAPLTVWKARSSVRSLKKAVQDREPDEDVFIGNIEKDDVSHSTVLMDPRGKFVDYIEILNDDILEGIMAPVLNYLGDANLASADKVLEVIDRHIQGIQRQCKRIVEKDMFEVVLALHGKTRPEQLPRIQWGSQRTGVEDLDLMGVAELVKAKAITPAQSQDLLRRMGLPLEEPKPEDEPLLKQPKDKPDPKKTGDDEEKQRVLNMLEKVTRRKKRTNGYRVTVL